MIVFSWTLQRFCKFRYRREVGQGEGLRGERSAWSDISVLSFEGCGSWSPECKTKEGLSKQDSTLQKFIVCDGTGTCRNPGCRADQI